MLVAPLKTAVIESFPLGSDVVLRKAVPSPCTAATPKTVPPDRKVTSPVGAAADNDGVTVAVNNTGPPTAVEPDVTSKAVV